MLFVSFHLPRVIVASVIRVYRREGNLTFLGTHRGVHDNKESEAGGGVMMWRDRACTRPLTFAYYGLLQG